MDILETVEIAPRTTLTYMKFKLGLKNDAALAKILKSTPVIISKVKHSRQPLGSLLLLRFLELTNMKVSELACDLTQFCRSRGPK